MNVQRRRLDRLEARLSGGQMPVLIAFLPAALDEDDQRAEVARLAEQEGIESPIETMILETSDGSEAQAEVVADFDAFCGKSPGAAGRIGAIHAGSVGIMSRGLE